MLKLYRLPNSSDILAKSARPVDESLRIPIRIELMMRWHVFFERGVTVRLAVPFVQSEALILIAYARRMTKLSTQPFIISKNISHKRGRRPKD
jgi:hypothetical protein